MSAGDFLFRVDIAAAWMNWREHVDARLHLSIPSLSDWRLPFFGVRPPTAEESQKLFAVVGCSLFCCYFAHKPRIWMASATDLGSKLPIDAVAECSKVC